MSTRRRGRGEGSIVQRGDGRWMARMDLGFVDGRRLRKQFYAPTRKLVARKLNDAIARHQRGAVVATNEQLTVGTYLDQWLSTVSVRPMTQRQYEQVVRLYLKPAIGPVRLARLTPEHVRALILGLEKRGLSVRTATLARDILRIALAQAVREDLLVRNVATLVRRPKGTRRKGPTFSRDEARILLDALALHRLDTIVTCGIALGLRKGEVLGFQWPDVDTSAARLHVHHALQTIKKDRVLVEVKSRESHRTIALPAVVVRAFERQRMFQSERRLAAGGQWHESDFVFTTRTGRPLDGGLVLRDLKRVAARIWMGGRSDCAHTRLRAESSTAGPVCLDCDARRFPPVTFHGLRHSCSSLLLAAGVPLRDVSELLGHSDVRLTLTNYAHVRDEGRAKMAGVIDDVFDTQTDTQANGRG